MYSSSMIFQISKCSNLTLTKDQPRCKSPKQIDDFIKRIQINTWSNFYRPNLEDHKSKRSELRLENYETMHMLDPNFLRLNLFNIRENNV